VSPEEVQALVDDATFDYVTGHVESAISKLGEATAALPESFEAWLATAEVNFGVRRLDEALAAGERALAIRKNDPLAIATLSRIWMERGDKAQAERYGAMARVQGWREELKSPPSGDAGGLR
jgi:tetratricopeptide (TPR) repeat protein